MNPRLLAVVVCTILQTSVIIHAQGVPPLNFQPSPDTRLLVFAPHPDDETIGAAGLIQRVLAARGSVLVVVMTSGDALLQGVELMDKTTNPNSMDFRRYGRLREQESERAMTALGLASTDIKFLGFPDDGLCLLASKNLSARSSALESPYTRRIEPPAAERVIRGITYRGSDVRREVGRLAADFRPTIVVLPDPGDEHPDHCSTDIFVEEAVGRAATGSGTPRLLHYLVHYQQWPSALEDTVLDRLHPPATFPEPWRWRTLRLTPLEAERKSLALLTYVTQTSIMKPFMLAFAHQNELFLEAEPHAPPTCWCAGNPIPTNVPSLAPHEVLMRRP